MGKFRDYFEELSRTEEFPQLTLFPVFTAQTDLSVCETFYLLLRDYQLHLYFNLEGIDRMEFNVYLKKYGASMSKLIQEQVLLKNELKRRARYNPKQFKRALKKVSRLHKGAK